MRNQDVSNINHQQQPYPLKIYTTICKTKLPETTAPIPTINSEYKACQRYFFKSKPTLTSTSSLPVPQGVATDDGCTSWGSLLRHSIGIGNGLYLYSMALGHCINVLITCINRGWSEILVAWPQCRAVLARRCFVKSRPP